ncbi:scaffolding protein [Paenibacillus sp. J5C_2022]|uniref:phage scaffolding protein n=1 Tax=Paenibacillus sp. J5C2022 TaxID=2977129 RepID=UPI0021CE589E|nr:scaffolding protein [Paenibacillus sp. J5C2022]MCU6709349.1 scaffolding protein [Paenibacillus sp. J5C2022]
MSNEVIETNKYRLALDLQTFSDDPDPEPTPEPTFTQAELEAKIAERLGRERKKYADYDDLKAKLTEFETAEAERQKAAMTEQERIQAELDAAKRAAEEADSKSAAAIEAANQRVIKAEFKIAAAGANIRKDALDDAYVLVDKAGISVDDGGNVVGVKEALEALVDAKPYLIEQAPAKPKKIGEPNNPEPDEKKTLEAQLEDAKKQKNFSKVVELSNKLINFK